MNPRPTKKSPHTRRIHIRACLIAAMIMVGILASAPASATLDSIATDPPGPTLCDRVILVVYGTMPDPCYHLIRTELDDPVLLPTMGPIPTYEVRVRLTVQEPNPFLRFACPTVLQPYKAPLPFREKLPVGRYFVRATEYLVPFTQDSTAAPKDSSTLASSFDVSGTSPCPPELGCFILSFGPSIPSRLGRCDATARPGGTACFDVLLMNESPVGGVQTEIVVYNPRPIPVSAEVLRPISVETSRRVLGFQVAWTAEGSRAKIILFTATNATIAPGQGPILHVCYAVAPEAPEGLYPMFHQRVIVADPAGEALPECPTFVEIVGSICVVKTSCDLNGDGVSDIRDVILLVHCALAGHGGTEACPDSVAARADCNGDGALDVRDVICCVRRILSGGGFGTGGGSGDPTDPGTTRIGFAGSARWITPTDGRATIDIEPGDRFGGIQFAVTPTGAARVRSLTLTEPVPGHALEWTVENGAALAMLYRTDPAAPSVPSKNAGSSGSAIRIDVAFEPIPGAGNTGRLSIGGVGAATLTAEAAATSIQMGSVDLPASPTASAPSVSAPAPNPFATETAISYSLPTERHVAIRIYDLNGRLVRTLVNAMMPAGVHRAKWDGRDREGRAVGSGVYYSKFVSGEVERADRLLRLR